jgi:hypothetical protein
MGRALPCQDVGASVTTVVMHLGHALHLLNSTPQAGHRRQAGICTGSRVSKGPRALLRFPSLQGMPVFLSNSI